jgi:hypothetical protein
VVTITLLSNGLNKMKTYCTVLGKRIKLEYIDDVQAAEDGISGDFRSDPLKIRIKSGLSEKEQKATLLHEIVHAIFFITGHSFELQDNTEEALVRAIEHGLADIVELKI